MPRERPSESRMNKGHMEYCHEHIDIIRVNRERENALSDLCLGVVIDLMSLEYRKMVLDLAATR